MSHKSTDWQTIAAHISETQGRPFRVQTHYPVTGGCINHTYRIEGMGQNYFVKLNWIARLDMFAAEAEGLAALSQPAVIKVPTPICWGTTDEQAYLVIEYVALFGDSQVASRQLGQQLAVLHQVTQPHFGWHRHNYLGTTPQLNHTSADWVSFWQQQRLGYQLQLAAERGYGGQLQDYGQQLLDVLGVFFQTYQPAASLLHGDLWSGNYAINPDREPVIFDPAVYYGDRETDIAMTELFGGFPVDFYAVYQEYAPLDVGYSVRKGLYNLYHILNHLNLFGGSYAGQAERMIQHLLSETR